MKNMVYLSRIVVEIYLHYFPVSGLLLLCGSGATCMFATDGFSTADEMRLFSVE